jgi:hypothetical protein
MLHQGWVMMNLAEFERLLALFEQKAMISPAENHELLELAKTSELDQLPKGQDT